MNRQTLADVLQDTNQTGSYTLATVLEGAETGSQLLLRDGNAVWQTRNAELLQRQLAVLQACTATGFLTLDGQRVFAERFGAMPQLVVCGGGHVAAALVKQAKLLGLPVLAIDDREEFANEENFFRIPCASRTVYCRKLHDFWNDKYEIAYKTNLTVHGYRSKLDIMRSVVIKFPDFVPVEFIAHGYTFHASIQPVDMEGV